MNGVIWSTAFRHAMVITFMNYQHKVGPSILGEALIRLYPFLKIYKQLMVSGGRRLIFFSGVAPSKSPMIL